MKQSNKTKACMAVDQKVDLRPKIFVKQKGYFMLKYKQLTEKMQ